MNGDAMNHVGISIIYLLTFRSATADFSLFNDFFIELTSSCSSLAELCALAAFSLEACFSFSSVFCIEF